ncbi:hypothetical protein M408DRAFT_330076 [Serendipita vermifera MAFF 305830]|uniref:Uncharacterized protein n=1 Tax=Serendipita vermifera MAFF 305830 TaxID=933852 RepID=A0A0C3AS19_SERVB|nr:hypothetical protein M408DRAFT_330076 [Serendipita vermifera MAFF 305830]
MPSYWSKFPDFDHNESALVETEFERLAQEQGWIEDNTKKKKSKRYRKEWGECLESEFTQHYGDSSRLEGWQALCSEVGIEDVPQSIKGCKKVLKTQVWVNIVDFVNCRRTGEPILCHESLQALRKYIRKTKKTFPLETAKADGFLAGLLITVGSRSRRPGTLAS